MDPRDIQILFNFNIPKSETGDKHLERVRIIELAHVRARDIIYLIFSHLNQRESRQKSKAQADDEEWETTRPAYARAVYNGDWSLEEVFEGLNETQSLDVIQFFLKKTFCETKILSKATCQITVIHTVKYRIESISSSRCTLIKDLELFFTDRQLSDVTLVMDGGEVKAHKAILAARSPVFKAMFSHDMKETKCNRVEILDVKLDAMEEVLKFIYTGETSLEIRKDECQVKSKSELDHKFAIRLLYSAAKYQLEELMDICEAYLSDILSEDSFYDSLVATECFLMPDLRGHISRFLRENSFSILDRAINNRSIFLSSNFLMSQEEQVLTRLIPDQTILAVTK